MFVKNDTSGEHRYYNGMIGEVTAVSADGIEVRSKGSDATFLLQEEEWTNAKYVLDEETKEITEILKEHSGNIAEAGVGDYHSQKPGTDV